MQIHEVLQFPSTNKMRKQKGTKKKDENWEFRDKSDKVRESMKWWLKKMERERERERETNDIYCNYEPSRRGK